MSKPQTFGNAEVILLTSFFSLRRNVDLRHCDSVCNLGPDEETQQYHKESSSPHMSNLIKTEAHVQVPPSESQTFRDLQISKVLWQMHFLRLRVSAVPNEAEKWGFSKAKSPEGQSLVPKLPVLHVPYSWKLETVMEETWRGTDWVKFDSVLQAMCSSSY